MKNAILWINKVFGNNREQEVINAWQRVFDSNNPDVKIILLDLQTYCLAGRTSFVAGDPHQTSFNEGARDVYLHIQDMINLKTIN